MEMLVEDLKQECKAIIPVSIQAIKRIDLSWHIRVWWAEEPLERLFSNLKCLLIVKILLVWEAILSTMPCCKEVSIITEAIMTLEKLRLVAHTRQLIANESSNHPNKQIPIMGQAKHLAILSTEEMMRSFDARRCMKRRECILWLVHSGCGTERFKWNEREQFE